jgi:uncharacterized protein YidB (DUF937 family)
LISVITVAQCDITRRVRQERFFRLSENSGRAQEQQIATFSLSSPLLGCPLLEEGQVGLFDQVLGGAGNSSRSGGISPITLGLLGLLAYRTFEGKGRLADMLGRTPTPPTAPAGAVPGTPNMGGGLGGLLSGFLGGAGGGALSRGLGDLLGQFQQNGHGETAQSWVSDGSNKVISPSQLEQVLGPDKIAWLMQQTGMSQTDLLTGLSRELPGVVDKLTPDGRIPTDDEANRLL